MSREESAGAVIVAAGGSRRMGGQDKLEADLCGRPVLRWTVETMADAPGIDEVVVVSAADRVESLRALSWLRRTGAQVVAGGRRRQDSVALGVRACLTDLVLVHDAARPLLSAELIERVVAGVREHGAAVPVLPVVDALKRLEGQSVTAGADRSGLFRAQTPQGARRALLMAAIEAHAHAPDLIPDEVELLHRIGVMAAAVPGDAANIKLTLPEDLALARRLAGPGAVPRLAMGSDSHPFGPGDGLRLGGLAIDGAPRLQGHSDGDVVLHALCDALLGAAGLGDLGRLFPSGEQETRGIDSRELLGVVLASIRDAGSHPVAADVTIVGARPRLGGPRLDAIADSIARSLGVEPERVSVKASSGNLSGDEGAGRAISATCLVSLATR